MTNQSDIDQAYRTMIIIWLILLFSQVVFLGVVFSLGGGGQSAEAAESVLGANPEIVLGAAILAVTNIAFALFVRRRAIEQAIADQNINHLRTGLVVGCALCESVSIMGLVLAVVFSYPYFIGWFAAGIIGIFLQFPRRASLIAAGG